MTDNKVIVDEEFKHSERVKTEYTENHGEVIGYRGEYAVISYNPYSNDSKLVHNSILGKWHKGQYDYLKEE